jgi:zeta-carotene desaturase
VFLAGDWTATGWPATMEGAVRSGYLAAETLARAAGHNNPRFISPDLSAAGFMRWFA